MMRAAVLAALVAGASGHGALTFPRPRQALDKELKGKGGRPLGAGCPVGPGGRESNGQSCYWFSNGCNIGCDACDGTLTSAGHDDESYMYAPSHRSLSAFRCASLTPMVPCTASSSSGT